MNISILPIFRVVGLVLQCACGCVCGTVSAETPPKGGEAPATLEADSLDRFGGGERSMRLTLPDGRRVLGILGEVIKSGEHVNRISGTIQHPEAGFFSIDCSPNGELSGALGFNSEIAEWRIVPVPDSKQFKWQKFDQIDVFRPRNFKPLENTEAMIPPRGKDDDALAAKPRIQEIAPGKLRIGEVILDKETRTVRFPAKVNMTTGTVEYVVVANTGKRHESMFTTAVMPRDIHVAMLLLGVKPERCKESADKGLVVPKTADVGISAEWQASGTKVSRTVGELITIKNAGFKKDGGEPRKWLYNGSAFNAAGFAADSEGSIVALSVDDLALINNARNDRVDDEIHSPTTDAMPPLSSQVTLIMTLPPPSSP